MFVLTFHFLIIIKSKSQTKLMSTGKRINSAKVPKPPEYMNIIEGIKATAIVVIAVIKPKAKVDLLNKSMFILQLKPA